MHIDTDVHGVLIVILTRANMFGSSSSSIMKRVGCRDVSLLIVILGRANMFGLGVEMSVWSHGIEVGTPSSTSLPVYNSGSES